MNTTHKTSRLKTAATLALTVLAAASVAGGLSGCRGQRSAKPPRQFIPDMDDSPKARNQSQTAFFQDGRSMRPHVAGTVAFGADMDPAAPSRANYLKENPLVFQGFDPAKPKTAEGDPAFEPVIPAAAIDQWIAEANVAGTGFNTSDAASRTAAMTAMIKRGQERFNIYCSACHGYEGDGQGLVGVRWGYPVPSYHDPKYKDRSIKTGKDGYLFSVIRNGVPAADPAKESPKMPSYADKISVSDSWAVISYIRALQAARTDAAPAKAGATPVEAGSPVAAATSKEAAK
jgi:mono/diheme cytochrome c family protein